MEEEHDRDSLLDTDDDNNNDKRHKEGEKGRDKSSGFSICWRVLTLFRRQVTFLCSLNLVRLPFVCLYYFYVWIPLFILALVLKYVLVVLQVSSRRSSSFKRLIKHYIAFHKTIINIIRKIRRTSLSELTEWILATIYEVVFTIFDESDDSLYDVANPLQFAELIGYIEVDEPHNMQLRKRDHRMRLLMHHHVPSRPFRASVRVHPHSSSHSQSRDSCGDSGERSSQKAQDPATSSRLRGLAGLTARWIQGRSKNWLREKSDDRGRRRHHTDCDYRSGFVSNTAAMIKSFGFRRGTGDGNFTGEGGSCSVSELWSEMESVSRTSMPRSPGNYLH